MQCDPKNAILPANRAMAFLKLEEWRSAEADCSLALSLDEKYVKAYQRRGTARKNLKKYEIALEDFQHVLLLEPNNNQAKSDIEQVVKLMNEVTESESRAKESPPAQPTKNESNIKGMFNSKSDKKEVKLSIPGQIYPVEKAPHQRSTTPLKRIQIVDESEANITELSTKLAQNQVKPAESSKKSKILIEEIESSPASEKVTDEVAKKPVEKPVSLAKKVEKEINATSTAEVKVSTEKKVKMKKPSSSVQFMTSWSKLGSDEEKKSYLSLLQSQDYPKIFKHSMEPTVLPDILSILNQMAPVSPHVLGLSRIPRISAMIMFLNEKDGAFVRNLTERIQTESTLSASELKQIKSCFS